MYLASGAGDLQTPSTGPTNRPPQVTRGHSCVLCFQRKVKCDGQRPCSTCIKARGECIAKPPTRPMRRRAQISRGDLLARLRRCEQLLESHGVKVEEDDEVQRPINQQILKSPDEYRSPESAADVGKLIIGRGHSRYFENDLWSELGDELHDSHEVGPSPSPSADDDDEYSTTPLAFYADGGNLLFARPMLGNLRASHPQPVKIFMLWQTFLNNVNPLVKLLHAPTVQQSILEASGNLDNVPAATEALMFAIYLCAVTSLVNDDCERIMGDSRHTLLIKFSNFTQQALINAEILRTSNLVVLQAFTLFLLAMRDQYEPYSTWLLAGLAIRIGKRIGLHRESASREVSIFEAEMRRRLWWQILILDFRSAQLSGTKVDADAQLFETKRPLKVNDSDLSPSMKELPVEHPGITDMLFCSIRYEIGDFMRNHRSLRLYDGSGQRGTATISLVEKDKAIDDLENMLEQNYLKYTDPSIPLHFLSAGLARGAVYQMRLLAHHPRQYPDKGASLPQSEKDMIFSTTLKMIEQDNLGKTNQSIQGFRWHLRAFLQVDALIYLISELRTRVEGEEVERAWQQIDLVFENNPEIIADAKNPLYFAIGNLTLKAWEKRLVARGQNQGSYQVGTPEFIVRLRSYRKAAPAQSTNLPDSIVKDESSNQVCNTSQVSQGENFQELEMASEFDPTLLAPYTEMDTTPMDWEYWQELLEGNTWLMMNNN